MKLQWRLSYETILFDTPDGDLGDGQYADSGKGFFYVRRSPKNNSQFVFVKNIDPLIDKTLVHIIPGFAYYDEFILPNGRCLRIKSSQQNYKSLAIKGALPLTKDITAQEVIDAQKDDVKWKDIPYDLEAEKKRLKGIIP